MVTDWKQTVAVIATMIGAMIALATFMGGIEKRLEERIDRLDTRADTRLARVEARLDEVSDRLARLEGAVLPL